MRGAGGAAALLLALPFAAFAEAPDSSPAPPARPAAAVALPDAAEAEAMPPAEVPVTAPPRPRPARAAIAGPVAVPATAPVAPTDPAPAPAPAVTASAPPPARPLAAADPVPPIAVAAPRIPAMRPRPRGTPTVSLPARNQPPRALPPQGGQICDDPRLEGVRISRIASANPACGILQPVRVTEVSGVRLSRPITVTCRMASRLADWVTDHAVPIADKLGRDLVALTVYDSYSCRPRNNVRGQRISEHGKGQALDIAGFLFAGGHEVTVLDGWKRGEDGQFLRALHRSACGPFNTVLGPSSDRFHRNHFHFDVGNSGRSPYCR
jgi:hypothetical protein